MPFHNVSEMLQRAYKRSNLNKQSRTADSGWFFNFGFGRGANNSSP